MEMTQLEKLERLNTIVVLRDLALGMAEYVITQEARDYFAKQAEYYQAEINEIDPPIECNLTDAELLAELGIASHWGGQYNDQI